MKRILKNIAHLFLAQGFNFLFPLITLPYLTSALGLRNFGIFAFCQAIIFYFQVVVDYGFNLTATRKVAALHNSAEELREIVTCVIAAKVSIALVVTFFGGILLYAFHLGNSANKLYVFSYFSVLASVFYPIWYFQGIEKMQAVAWVNAVSRIVGIGAMLQLVKGPDDIALAGLIQALPSIVAALIAFGLLCRDGVFNIYHLSLQRVFDEIFEGRHIFQATALSAVLANTGTFVLGIFHPPEVVGVYSAAERVVKSAVGCFAPITQAIYPGNVKAFTISIAHGFATVFKISRYVLLLALVFAISGMLVSPMLVGAFKWHDPQYVVVLQGLAPWAFLGVLNNILGIQTLTAMGNGRIYSRLFMVASTIAASIMIIGVKRFGISAVLVGMNMSECCLSILLAYSVASLSKRKLPWPI